MNIANMKVERKIIVLMLIMVFGMLAIAGIGYYYQKKANEDITTMYSDRLLPVKQLNMIRTNFRDTEADMWRIFLAPLSATERSNLSSLIAKNTPENDKLWADYKATYLDPYEKERIPKYESEMTLYRKARTEAMEMATGGKNIEAYNYFMQNGYSHLEQAATYLTELAEYNAKIADEINTQNDKDFAFATKVSMGSSIAIILAAFALGLFIARLITRPLNKMVESIAKDADGMISIRATDICTKDELGFLAASLNALINQVRQFVTTAAEASERVAASSEELTASAQESAEVYQQIASSITDVATGAGKQLNAVNETMAVVEQISASIQQTAATANNVASMAVATTNAVKDGKQAVDQAVTQMDSIGKGSALAQGAVEKLADSSKQISQIVDMISGIADQTNLLALNAAIEAARAGDSGRGFAVVADEVRKLAEQSQGAAKQIADLIGENTTSIDSAVGTMRAGAEDVRTGVAVVRSAGQAFEAIAGQITRMADQVREISAATQEVAAGSQRIVDSMRNIEGASKTAASQTETVSAATEEQSATLEEIASSSQVLATMAEELQKAVRGFKM